MKKNITESKGPRQRSVKKSQQQALTIGVDLGDRTSRYCVLDGEGKVLLERSIATSKKGLAQAFASMGASRIAIEVGTHSPWIKRLLESWNHEVIVANARRVKLITESTRKDDRLDARTLARLARVDPQLSPIRHRSETAQGHLVMIRARAGLVEMRTKLVNSVRGLTKSMGERLSSCDASQMSAKRLAGLPPALQEA
jgi:transposase